MTYVDGYDEGFTEATHPHLPWIGYLAELVEVNAISFRLNNFFNFFFYLIVLSNIVIFVNFHLFLILFLLLFDFSLRPTSWINDLVLETPMLKILHFIVIIWYDAELDRNVSKWFGFTALALFWVRYCEDAYLGSC